MCNLREYTNGLKGVGTERRLARSFDRSNRSMKSLRIPPGAVKDSSSSRRRPRLFSSHSYTGGANRNKGYKIAIKGINNTSVLRKHSVRPPSQLDVHCYILNCLKPQLRSWFGKLLMQRSSVQIEFLRITGPPVTGVNGNHSLANLSCYRWQKHCRGLYQTPMAA